MKRCTLFNVFAFLALATVAGCSSSSDESTDSGGPVAATPLQGSIAGKDFVGKIAIAPPGFQDEGSKRQITIYDIDVGCNGGSGGGHEILTSIEWTAGLTKNLKLDFSGGSDNQTVTFVTG